MDPKNYRKVPEKPLSFDDWKGSKAPQYGSNMLQSLKRLHNIDYEKEFEEMLKIEYNEYLNNLNSNWLLK